MSSLETQLAAHRAVMVQVIEERDRLERRLAAIDELLASVPDDDPAVARALALARGKRAGRQRSLLTETTT